MKQNVTETVRAKESNFRRMMGNVSIGLVQSQEMAQKVKTIVANSNLRINATSTRS